MIGYARVALLKNLSSVLASSAEAFSGRMSTALLAVRCELTDRVDGLCSRVDAAEKAFDLDAKHESFVNEAAKRGIFAYVVIGADTDRRA